MPSAIVRDSRKADLPAVLDIYAREVCGGLATFEQVPPSLDDMEARRRQILDRGLPYLVAERDGAVVGYAHAGPHRPRPAYRYAVEDSVYVARDMHGRGIGGALLRALIGRCESGPWRQMVAVIGDSGNAASIGLHERLGFRHVGILEAVGFKLGRWVDTVVMQRPLGEGRETVPVEGRNR